MLIVATYFIISNLCNILDEGITRKCVRGLSRRSVQLVAAPAANFATVRCSPRLETVETDVKQYRSARGGLCVSRVTRALLCWANFFSRYFSFRNHFPPRPK